MSVSDYNKMAGCCYDEKVIFIRVEGGRFMLSEEYLWTLAHELQHWYFPEMEHGLEFDNNVEDIIKGSGLWG